MLGQRLVYADDGPALPTPVEMRSYAIRCRCCACDMRVVVLLYSSKCFREALLVPPTRPMGFAVAALAAHALLLTPGASLIVSGKRSGTIFIAG
jgi:hypothetical protein